MAETDESLAVRVQAHLRAANLPVPALPDILPVLTTAREDLARFIAFNPDRRRELRLQPAFALDVVDGEADMTDMLSDPYRVLIDGLPFADVRDEQNRRLYFLGRDRYDEDQPTAYGYFTFEAQTLLARLKDEDLGESTFQALITANIVPAAAEVVPSCVSDLARIAAGMLTPPPPKKGKPE
jgi:hypothetical protein